MPEATKVLYDVNQAIKELTKLDKKVDKSGKKTKKSFDEAGKGFDQLGGAIGGLNPQIGGLITKFSGLAATATPTGVAMAGIAAAAVAITASFVDVAAATRSADNVIGDFLSNAKKAQRFADLLSGSEDARRAFKFEEAKDEIAIRRLAITEEKIKREIARDGAAKLVVIEKDKLRQIAAAQKSAANKTLSLQKRLADRQRGDLVGSVGVGRPTGAAIIDLTARAKAEAEKGNLDTAEALLSRAQGLSDELGNHVFFTNKIESANNAINRSLEGQIKDSKTETGTLSSLVSAQQKQVDLSRQDLEFQKGKTLELTRQLTLIGAETGVLSRQKKAEKRFTAVEQGQRDIGSGQTVLANIFDALGNEGFFRKITNAVADGFSAITSPATLRTVREGAGSLTLIEDAIERAIGRTAPGGFTTGEIDQLGKLTQISQEQLNILKTDQKAGILSLSDRRVQRLEAIFAAIGELQVGTQQLGPVGANQNIVSRAAELKEEANRGQQNAAKLAGAANVSIAVVVQGGPIDGETIKALTPVIRREARKAVSTLTAN